MAPKQQKRGKATPSGTPEAPVGTSSVGSVGRGIGDLSRLPLFVRAGGRCEFDGCNKYLLAHPLTLTPGNFAQMAHIVAFREQGLAQIAAASRLYQ